MVVKKSHSFNGLTTCDPASDNCCLSSPMWSISFVSRAGSTPGWLRNRPSSSAWRSSSLLTSVRTSLLPKIVKISSSAATAARALNSVGSSTWKSVCSYRNSTRRNVRMRSLSGCSNLIGACSADAEGSSAAVFMPLFCATAVLTANSNFPRALRGEIEVAPMRELDLPARRLRRAAVVDDVVRGFQARRAIDLRADHRERLRFRNRIAPHQALELRRLRRVDDEDPIDEVAEIRLDEQRHGHERVGRLELRELGARASADQRVQDGFEPAALVVVSEDQRAQRRAVELAGRQHHTGPEFRGDGGQAGLPGGDDLARHDVRVDERRAELHEHGAHERFAARNAARD